METIQNTNVLSKTRDTHLLVLQQYQSQRNTYLMKTEQVDYTFKYSADKIVMSIFYNFVVPFFNTLKQKPTNNTILS